MQFALIARTCSVAEENVSFSLLRRLELLVLVVYPFWNEIYGIRTFRACTQEPLFV